MHRVVLATAACAACAEVPDRFRPTREPEPVDASELHVFQASGVRLELAATGVRLPSSIKINSTEILATAGDCANATLVGSAVHPFQRAFGGARPLGFDEAANTVDTPMLGPIAAQFVVAYAVPYTCEGKQLLGGVATITMFPSGRIFRHDAISPSRDAIANPPACGGCNGGGTPKIEAFWAFDPSGSRVEFDGVKETELNGTPGSAAFTCAKYSAHTVAMSWRAGGVPRSTQDAAAGGPMEFINDVVPGATTVDPTERTASSSIFVVPEAIACSDMASRVLPEQIALVKDGKSETLALDENGFYHTDTQLGGTFELHHMNGASAATEGFAVKLVIGSTDHIRVSSSDGSEAPFLIQAVGPRTILWFEDGIPAGGLLTVEVL